MNDSKVAHIELASLRECRVQLRPVDKRTINYRELRDSIQEHGLWQPLLVRPAGDKMFDVVDGFYRYSCCKELRVKTVPCLIRELNDREVMIVQIQANAVRLETNPIDFARQMWRIIRDDKQMTVGQMAHTIKKNPSWVRKMLNITRLCEEVSISVRRGEVTISVAYEIAKVPSVIQKELLPQAVVLPAVDFLPIVKRCVRKFKEAIKTGRMEDYYKSIVKPVPHLRKMKELRAELKTSFEGAHSLVEVDAETPIEGWKACLDWVLHLDPASIAIQEANFISRQIYEDDQAELRKQDRDKMREDKL